MEKFPPEAGVKPETQTGMTRDFRGFSAQMTKCCLRKSEGRGDTVYYKEHTMHFCSTFFSVHFLFPLI